MHLLVQYEWDMHESTGGVATQNLNIFFAQCSLDSHIQLL